jgi:hypothetical protein
MARGFVLVIGGLVMGAVEKLYRQLSLFAYFIQ